MIHLLLILISLLVLVGNLVAQESPDLEELVQQRWLRVSTTSFEIYSRLSRADTERFASELERWRAAAVALPWAGLSAAGSPPVTQVYLVDNEAAMRVFADGEEAAYFYSSPRANFLLLLNSDSALALGRHHYAHFLLNNSATGLPRWYEEGLANYLSRLSIRSDELQLRAFQKVEFEVNASLNVMLSLNSLLYDDAALASPRLIQIANLKSAMFLHYLLHAHELEGFQDRRGQIQTYLAHLQQGRTERFAFDQAFDLSLEQLEREYERYLQQVGGSDDAERAFMTPSSVPLPEVIESAADDTAMALAELALHAGRFAVAEHYFGSQTGSQSTVGRAHSGLADALRMRAEIPEEPLPEIESHYLRAITLEETNPQLHLDYGQYLQTELESCEAGYSAQERQRMTESMRSSFARALELAPESAETNLSYAALFLQTDQDWRQGRAYHSKAFALLPSDSFVMEQAIDYAIAAGEFERAKVLITRLARPLHFWGTPQWVADLRASLNAAEGGQKYSLCSAEVL